MDKLFSIFRSHKTAEKADASLQCPATTSSGTYDVCNPSFHKLDTHVRIFGAVHNFRLHDDNSVAGAILAGPTRYVGQNISIHNPGNDPTSFYIVHTKEDGGKRYLCALKHRGNPGGIPSLVWEDEFKEGMLRPIWLDVNAGGEVLAGIPDTLLVRQWKFVPKWSSIPNTFEIKVSEHELGSRLTSFQGSALRIEHSKWLTPGSMQNEPVHYYAKLYIEQTGATIEQRGVYTPGNSFATDPTNLGLFVFKRV